MKKTLKTLTAATLIFAALALAGCGEKEPGAGDKTIVKIGVVGEYNDQWETINGLLAGEGIKVELVKFTDYAAPNRALDDGEIDLNAFQHKAFLANDIKEKHYDITDVGDTIIAPLAVFNNKERISSMDEIKDGDVIAIPSDLTNGGRALKLLEKAGLIECDPAKGYTPTKADITAYHTKIEIMEAESATLANILPDCAAAIINGGNAFTAGLSFNDDAIFVEDVDPKKNEYVSQLVNVIAARTADKDNEVYKKIVEAYHTDAVKKTMDDSYKGAFICAW